MNKGLKGQVRPFPDKNEVMGKTPDPGTRAMLEHLQQAGIETAFDRFDAQKPHCGFGLQGTCCRICNMGPCRVTAQKKGVCGADRDVVVARNLLRWVAAGVASHGARGREVLLALKQAATGRLPLSIRGANKVRAVAKAFGVYAEDKTVEAMAEEIADILLEDLFRTVPGVHRTIAAMAPPERVGVWSGLDILPVGSYHEVFEALHRTGTGTDGDADNLLRQVLRCGLAFAWNSVVGPAIAMDCLYGPPQRQRIKAGFGSIRENYVNIALHGHSPVLPAAIVTASRNPELVEAARQAGAEGIRLYGICCSGLSALYRFGEVHPLANALGAELVMGTGALDVWVADLQDIYPGISEVAACFHTKIVTTSDSGRLPGAIHWGFDHTHSNLDEAEEIAHRIVRLAIAQYPAAQNAKCIYSPYRGRSRSGLLGRKYRRCSGRPGETAGVAAGRDYPRRCKFGGLQ
jgi:carbon-monoxide dehydrogenase catalytic subunit